MTNGFDYGALWSIARDSLDALSGLTRAIIGDGRVPLVAPWAIRNPRPGYYEKWEAALKTLPERRAKAVDAKRKAAENLAKLLAEDRFIAPLAGVWPPHAPEVARNLSNGLKMAASAARAAIASRDDAHIDQPKRSAVAAQYTLQAVVGELERRQDVAALAYQRQVERLRAEHPDWSADEALASWQNGRGADNGDFIERLLAGPDDAELTPRELALLEAYLKQPVSLSAIQQENRATGQSETLAKRNKLTLIRDFNRNLQAAHSADRRLTPDGDDNTKANQHAEQGEDVSDDDSAIRLLNIFTNGLADERLEKMRGFLNNKESSVDDKLRKIDELIPIPPTVSAANLGAALGVSKTAIQKTTWYIQKRKGQKDVDTERRRDKYCQRGQEYEGDGGENDDD